MKMIKMLACVAILAYVGTSSSTVAAELPVADTEVGVGVDLKAKAIDLPAPDIGGVVTGGVSFGLHMGTARLGEERLEDYRIGVTNLLATFKLPDGMVLPVLTPASIANAAPVFYVDYAMGTNNDTAMSDIEVRITASDANNSLGKIVKFGSTNTYAPTAIGIRANGVVVEGDTALQKVNRIIVPIGSKYFTASAGEVQAFLNGYPFWNMKVEVVVKGTPMPPMVYRKQLPRWTTLRDGSNLLIRAINDGNPVDYDVGVSSVVGPGAVWTKIGTLRGGGLPLTLPVDTTKAAQFVSYIIPQ